MNNVLTDTAVEPTGTTKQTPAYIYGVTIAGGSAIKSNDLLAKVEDPDPTTGNSSSLASNQEVYTYAAAGDVLTMSCNPDSLVYETLRYMGMLKP